MKRFITTILLLAAVICTAADSVQMSLETKTVTAKEPTALILSSSTSTPPYFAEMPRVEGLEWLPGSYQREYSYTINGRTTAHTLRYYPFVAEKEGTYIIPETWVHAGGKKVKTKPLTIKVKKAVFQTRNGNGNELGMDDIIFSKIAVPEEKTNYYVGEYIPVEVRIYSLAGLQVNFAYPEITSEKGEIIFRNYQNVNKNEPRFDRPRRSSTQIKGRNYVCYIFQTEIKSIAAGKIELKAQTKTEISVPNQNSRRSLFDDAFFGYSYRTLSHTLRSTSPVLNIKPLPPLPQNTYYLGLTGEWNIASKISEKKTKIGNAITLTLQLSGTGGLEGLHPPELKLNGFRVYSPELSKDDESAVIRYTLIPTKAGTLPINLNFCTFDTGTGTYNVSKIAEKLTVEISRGIIPVSNNNNVVDTALPESNEQKQEEHKLAGIMYLKRLQDQDTAQNNYFWSWIIGIIGFGILAVILCEILAFLFRGSSTAANRRSQARKQKKVLMNKLKNAQSSQVYDLAPEISEYLNNALDLSPGTSLDESAEWIGQKNTELSNELKKLSAGAWAPGAEEFSEERKLKLMKLLTKLVCIFLFTLTPFLSAGELTQDDIIKAYDAGNFKEARDWYTQKLEKQGATPALLYNIGNCYYQEKDFAKALFCYERAHLLAPRDTEILRNLELTHRELNLPAVKQLNKPSDIPSYIRNQMTPEEWMILGAFGVSILLIAFGLRRFFGPRVTLPVAILGAVMLLLGSAMTVSQYQTVYSAERAIILESGIRLRALPAEQSHFLNDEKLKEAENVQIRERRNKWIRIKAGDAVGWVPAEAAGQLNGRKFTVF